MLLFFIIQNDYYDTKYSTYVYILTRLKKEMLIIHAPFLQD